MRLPFTGSYNTRPSTALSSASGIVGVGIVGTMVVGQSQGSDKDGRFINCFQATVKDEIAKTQKLYVIKRPGFAVNQTVSAGNIGTAIHVWAGQGTGAKVISAFGGTNSTIYDGTSSLGTITGKATAITETILSNTPTLAITSTDNSGWVYTTGGGLTAIASSAYPGASTAIAGAFAHLDGYAFLMTQDGRLHNSDLNSVVAWTSGNYVTTNAWPDQGVGCVRLRDSIIAFGKQSFEVYRNAGNASGSPLSRIDELTQLVGCTSADAIASVRDTIYWAGPTIEANIAIYSFNGQLQKVSTPEIENQLTLAGPSNISLTTAGFYGRHFVIVLASSTTFVYCVEEGAWHEWSGQVPLWYKADGVSTGSTIVNYCISKTSTSGRTFVLNPSSPTFRDNGIAYSAVIQTPKIDGGNSKWKTVNRLYVVGDQQTSTSDLTITWTDDDYTTWASARTVDLSDDTPNITRLGRFKRRAFALSHSANTPMRLEALDLDVTEGAT